MTRRIAVVGSGIAGLCTAWSLAPEAHVTLFEAGRHFGGHANTRDVTLDGVTHGVDTGFLVYNDRTYPGLIALFAELGVETAPSDMSFSVQNRASGLEWSGSSLDTVFAQRRNLLRPSFLGMLGEVMRFNRLATAIAEHGSETELAESVGDFLERHRFGRAFRDSYFLPMIGCIWSCPTSQMLSFPVATLIRFCHNHGLIQLSDRPQWRTVRGGSREYVRRMLARIPDARLASPVHSVRRLPPGTAQGAGSAGVMVATDDGETRFDDVVLACHTDQALALMADATMAERQWLGAIRYQRNRAVLHTDADQLPRTRRAWAAWNYERAPELGREQAAVCLHYWINRLQPLPWDTPVVVSLNPAREPDPRLVIDEIAYDHPIFDRAAIEAQARLFAFQGHSHLWFCGAWTRYGFHEDGLMSGMAVAKALRERIAADRLTPRAA